MKKISGVAVCLAIFLIVGLIGSGQALASIKESMHDFSGRGWNAGKGGEICKVCHTPHNTTSNVAPLWNHTLTQANFTVYSSPSLSLNAKVGQPNPASKACLSCHDGTVSIDAFGFGPNAEEARGGSESIAPGFKLGTDLSNDHPVSFTYDAALSTEDGGLHDPTVKSVPALGGKTIDTGMLINHKLECSSCHDVHKSKGDSPTANYLLLVKNTESALCLTCHNK
ncbi:MAG: cytochrome c3 family protein [Candidatus Omnitrophica bacterium]|nr:cytochrome c3 family protein [Candidatus Omnitrophota bacterium]